jgi:hypothetical protein
MNQMVGDLANVKDPIADAANATVVVSVSVLTVGGPTFRVLAAGGGRLAQGAVNGYKFVLETQRRREITAAALRTLSHGMNVIDDIAMGGRFVPPNLPPAFVQPVVIISPRVPVPVLVLPP